MDEDSALSESEAIAELEAMLYLQLYHNTLGEETLAANTGHSGTAIRKPLPVFNGTVTTALRKNRIKSVPLGLEQSCKYNPYLSVTKHVKKKTKPEESEASFIAMNVGTVSIKEEDAKSPADVLGTGKRLNFASSMPLVKQEVEVDISTENTTLHLKYLKEKKVKLRKKSKTPQMPLVKQEIEINENQFNNCTGKDRNVINKAFKMPPEQQTNMPLVKQEIEVDINTENTTLRLKYLKEKKVKFGKKSKKPQMPFVKQEIEINEDQFNNCTAKEDRNVINKAFKIPPEQQTVRMKETSSMDCLKVKKGAELGIAKCSNTADISASGSSIDTVGAKPRTNKVKEGTGKKSVSESIVRKPKSQILALSGKPPSSKSLAKSTVGDTKRKGQGNFGTIRLDRPFSSARNYKKSLGRLLTSSFGGQGKGEVVEVSSNSSDSESSDSDATTSTEATSAAGTPSKTVGSLHHKSVTIGQSASKDGSVSEDSDDSETLNVITDVQVIARAISKTRNKRYADTDSDSSDDGLPYNNVLGGKSIARSQDFAAMDCDLVWNVSSVDHDTIKTVNKQLLTEDKKDKWHVDEADRLVSQVSRYYGSKQVRCNNCSKEGHLSTNCPNPRKLPNCFLCGLPGHRGFRCPNRHCFNCLQCGHYAQDCRQKRRDLNALCPRCKMKGHQEQGCPDHWRQYHATLPSSKSLVQIKKNVNRKVYCSNCAKRGHFAFQCPGRRMDPFVFPTKPCVVRYDGQFSGCLGAYQVHSLTGGKHKKFNDDDEDSGSPPKKICPEGSISHGSGKQLLPLDVLSPYPTVSQLPQSSSQAALLPRGGAQPLSSKSLSAGKALSSNSLSSRSSSMLQPLLSEKKQSCKNTAKKDNEHRFQREFVLQGEKGAKVPNKTDQGFPMHVKSPKKKALSKNRSDTSATLTQYAQQFLHKQPKMGEPQKKKPISKGHAAKHRERLFVDAGDVLQKLTDSFSTDRQTLTEESRLAVGTNVKKGLKKKPDPAQNLAKLSQPWQKQKHIHGESSQAQCTPKLALRQEARARHTARQDEANQTHDGISQHRPHQVRTADKMLRRNYTPCRPGDQLEGGEWKDHRADRNRTPPNRWPHRHGRGCGWNAWQEQDEESPHQYHRDDNQYHRDDNQYHRDDNQYHRGDKQYSGWPKQHRTSYSGHPESQSATQPHHGHQHHRYNRSYDRSHNRSYHNQ